MSHFKDTIIGAPASMREAINDPVERPCGHCGRASWLSRGELEHAEALFRQLGRQPTVICHECGELALRGVARNGGAVAAADPRLVDDAGEKIRRYRAEHVTRN